MAAVDMAVVYQRALKKLHKKYPKHMIFKLPTAKQIEFMDLIREAQGYYIKEGIKDKLPDIVIPGIGSLLFNPLRAIAEQVKAEHKDTLYKYELDQLIKEKLANYYETKGDPFVRPRAKVRRFDINEGTFPGKDSII